LQEGARCTRASTVTSKLERRRAEIFMVMDNETRLLEKSACKKEYENHSFERGQASVK
jgi:hypothetical protein